MKPESQCDMSDHISSSSYSSEHRPTARTGYRPPVPAAPAPTPESVQVQGGMSPRLVEPQVVPAPAPATTPPHEPPRRLWVFGYGSLCWRPGFPYEERRIGRVDGYSRRFWQGSVTHRGTPGQPGRVATLVEHSQGSTWGCAFLVTDPAALRYLHCREVALGGYQTRQAAFAPREPGQRPFPVTLYLATEANPLWLGEAPLAHQAAQVAAASGRCGTNAEYVLRLVTFMRRHIPEERDKHLFELAALVGVAVGEGISPSAGVALSPGSGAGSPGGSPVKSASADSEWRRRCSQEAPDDTRRRAESSQEQPAVPRCR